MQLINVRLMDKENAGGKSMVSVMVIDSRLDASVMCIIAAVVFSLSSIPFFHPCHHAISIVFQQSFDHSLHLSCLIARMNVPDCVLTPRWMDGIKILQSPAVNMSPEPPSSNKTTRTQSRRHQKTSLSFSYCTVLCAILSSASALTA